MVHKRSLAFDVAVGLKQNSKILLGFKLYCLFFFFLEKSLNQKGTFLTPQNVLK